MTHNLELLQQRYNDVLVKQLRRHSKFQAGLNDRLPDATSSTYTEDDILLTQRKNCDPGFLTAKEIVWAPIESP